MEEIILSLVEAVARLNERLNEQQDIARVPGKDGRDGKDGIDAKPVTDEQIKAQAVEWLTANITQPKDGAAGSDGKDGKDGRDPTAAEIQLAVDLWFELNRETVRGQDGANGKDGADGKDGKDGKNGADGINGLNGKDGADGIGIALIEQRSETGFFITLDDGREFEIELPKPKSATMVGGGGLSKSRADELYAPIGSGGSKEQVFIGEPATLPTYPALIFTERTVDGQTVYEMQVNVP